MKNLFYLFLGVIFLSSCQKGPGVEAEKNNLGNKKLSLIVIKWYETGYEPVTDSSVYYKIEYDTVNNKIFLDTDSLNADHEYVYEYNNLGQLIKCNYLDAMNNNQPMTFTYTRTANALTITSNSQGVIEERVYNKTQIPGGYRYLQTVANPSGCDYAQFDFTNAHIPIQCIHFNGDINNPFDYAKRVYKFDNLGDPLVEYYYSPNQPAYVSGKIVRGKGSTKLLFDFMKRLKGTDFLYFWGYDTDNILGLEPERLSVAFFDEVNYSNKEIIGTIPAEPDFSITNTFYNFGEIKSTVYKLIPEYEEHRSYFYK